jgi:aspartyl aminopeptidase
MKLGKDTASVTTETAFAQDLIDFVHASPSPFHVVKNIKAKLAGAGFSRLALTDPWALKKGGKYYITRNDS